MNRNSQNDDLADGLTEDVITSLSNLRNLKVVSRNTVFTYRDKPVDVRQVAKELGVHYVIEGSVRKSGDTVRITAQLIDGATGHHLWADRYDRKPEDLFSLQDEIAEKVTQVLAGYSVERVQDDADNRILEGIGVVTGLNLKKSRIVIDHEEIKDFMASMEMSYMVTSSKLLKNLKPGDKVRFKIDTSKRMIVDILPMKE